MAPLGNDRLLIGGMEGPTGTNVVYQYGTNGALEATYYAPAAAWGQEFGMPLGTLGTDRVLIGGPWSSAASLFGTNGELQVTFTDHWTYYRQRFGSLVAALGTGRAVIGSEYGGPVYLFGVPMPVYWLGGTGNWSDPNVWWPGPPTGDDVVVLQAGAVVYVDMPDALVGALTLEPGSRQDGPCRPNGA